MLKTNRSIGLLLALVLWTVVLWASAAPAQSVLNLPLADQSILGTGATPDPFFTIPYTDGKGDKGGYTTWTRHGLGGRGPNVGGELTLTWGCHAHWATMAVIKPAPAGGRATIVQGCGVFTNLWATNPGEPNSEIVGGGHWIGDRLLGNVYSYYDGQGTAVASMFAGADTSSFTGMPFTLDVGRTEFKPAMAAQSFFAIPPEWQTVFGGNDTGVTGCCKAVITRDSYGFSVSVFKGADVKNVVNGKIPGKWLAGYPGNHQNLGAWEGDGAKGYNMNYSEGFAAILNGTRTLAIFHRKGTGWCYGVGQDNPALHNTYDSSGQRLCYDPSDHSKGGHGYPMIFGVMFVDMRQLYEVYQGTRQPWDVVPYWIGTMPGIAKGGVEGGYYDHATGTLYYNFGGGEAESRVYMRKVGLTGTPPPPPPPPPVDCQGVWSESLSDPTPLVCDATRVQTRTRTKTFTVTTPPSNGGNACPASPVITTETNACEWTPPPPPPVPKFVGAIRAQEQRKDGALRVTLEVPKAMTIPAKGAAVDVPLPGGVVVHGTVYAVSSYANGNWRVTLALPSTTALTLGVEMPVQP